MSTGCVRCHAGTANTAAERAAKRGRTPVAVAASRLARGSPLRPRLAARRCPGPPRPRRGSLWFRAPAPAANNDSALDGYITAGVGVSALAIPEVIDGAQSVVWDEAENRMHVQKALMEYLLLGRLD